MTWINQQYLNINRRIRSISYRWVLLVYGIILALLFPVFPILLCCVVFGVYFLFVELYIVRKKPSNATLRSVIDLIYIALSIYGKPMDNICVIVFLLIPIVNAINHTGKSNHPYLYVVGLYLIYVSMLFVGKSANKGPQLIYVSIAFSALLVVQWFTVKQWKKRNNNALLEDTIEDFFSYTTKHETVYRRIGQNLLEDGFPFMDLYCFISHDNFNTLFVVNGSHFVYNYHIYLEDKELKDVRSTRSCVNVDYYADGKKLCNNIVIAVPASTFKDNEDSTAYIYVICFNDNVSNHKDSVISSIEPELRMLSKCLYSERKIKKREKENLEAIKDKRRFVDSAINAMHFIKNRLSSLQTLTDVVNDLDSEKIDCDYIAVAKDAAKRSSIDLNSILQKSKYILDKENNPFKYQTKEQCTPRKIFATLRQVWENILSKSDINVKDIDFLDGNDYHIDVSLEGVEILFSDIIGNIKKYKNKQGKCYCSCDNTFFTIVFKNDFVDSQETNSLVHSYNENVKEEIIKRKTFGVSNIKAFVSDMDIQLKACIEKDEDGIEWFILTLNFKMIQNEASNY